MKKILILLLCLAPCANASLELSLINLYRKNNIKALHEKLESSLQNPLYWKEFLADKNVSLGFYEFNTPIIVVNKTDKNLKLFKHSNYKNSLMVSENIIFGKMGDKQIEGDLKTPVGVYNIERKFVPKDQFYGPLAFVLDYPNSYDKTKNKGGHGIWIHGYPTDNSPRDEQTKGCIALKNNLLKNFGEKLGVDKGVVIISEKNKIKVDKKSIENILAQLFKWRKAWKDSDINTYLDFYDKDFIRFDGQSKKQFSQFKKAIFLKKENKTIVFTNIAISPYPDIKQNNLFKINFHEIYKTKNYKFEGEKDLYIKLVNNKMQILTEK